MASGEEVVPASELAAANKQIRELQRLLGKKTMEAEILKEAVKFGRTKMYGSPLFCKSAFDRISLRKCIRPLASQSLVTARP